MRIQLFESSQNKKIPVLIENVNRQSHDILVKRSWPIINNILQTEYDKGYGSQFRSISPFQTTDTPSLFTWSLIAILSSYK